MGPFRQPEEYDTAGGSGAKRGADQRRYRHAAYRCTVPTTSSPPDDEPTRAEDGGTGLRAGVRSVGATTARVGLSGWQYDHWRGDFYPRRLAKRRWLEYVGERFPTVEVNGSFYSLQRPERYRAWRTALPDGAVVSVKGGRYLTHMLRLRNVHTALANFVASGVLELGDRLGPVLWQLPSDAVPDPDVLDAFLAALPTTFAAAISLAAEHDDKVHLDDGAYLDDGRGGAASGAPPGTRPIRHALEARSAAAVTDDHLAVLRRHQVALVDSDAGGAWPRFDRPTTDFAYLRLHGAPDVYHSGYTPAAIDAWAARVHEHLLAGRETVVYFDNDAERHAPWDALALDAAIVRRIGDADPR
jgi:uncharacterized protein YecE (DUF72 family)